jgi:hypothetical protein
LFINYQVSSALLTRENGWGQRLIIGWEDIPLFEESMSYYMDLNGSLKWLHADTQRDQVSVIISGSESTQITFQVINHWTLSYFSWYFLLMTWSNE